jgi:hypothetical protein
MKVYLIIPFFLTFVSIKAQQFKPFLGKLVYEMEYLDTNMRKLNPNSNMVVYTNDTIVRIENDSPSLGKQVLIHHTVLNKSYLLLNFPNAKFAIQTDHNKDAQTKDSIKQSTTYQYIKKFGKKKFAGQKARKLIVTNKAYEGPMTFYYLTDFSPKYINAFLDCPGLPVQYYVSTPDGLIKYTLIYFEEKTQNRDYFGIPSDYKKVTFDEFMKIVMPDAEIEK